MLTFTKIGSLNVSTETFDYKGVECGISIEANDDTDNSHTIRLFSLNGKCVSEGKKENTAIIAVMSFSYAQSVELATIYYDKYLKLNKYLLAVAS